jgi:putative DNA primase/helicase
MKIVTQEERLQEAILQAQHGHRVHPCHYITSSGGCSCGKCDASTHGKHPALTGWQKTATTSEAIIRQWWTDEPEANIGLATGPSSDLLIVDIDIRDGKNGFQDLQELDPRGLGFDGIETPKARTGSGGGQLYLLWPDACKLTTGSGIGGKAIDFRGIGGNAIAPGSRNNLGQYEWILSLEDCGKEECPEWLLSFLMTGKAIERAPQASGLILQVEDELSLEAHPGAEAGNRNGLLCKLVGSALASGIAPDEVIRQALAWNRRCKPPKAEAGIRKSAQALINSEFQKLREKASGSGQQALPTLKGLPASPAAEMVLITRQASTIKPQVLRWLWPNHIQQGAVNLIAGPEGRGKSLVSVDIAARTSTGSAWPDGSPCERGRVLYCSAEENIEAVIVPRLMAAAADLTRIEIVDGLGSSSDEGKVLSDIDLKKCLPAVYKKLKDIGEGEPFRLCIWDTFQSVCLTVDHKSNTEQKAIVQPLQAIADELGVAMICIEHHNRGGLGRGNPDAAILGGGLTRTARVIWHVVEDPESPESIRLFIPGKMNNCSKAEDLGWRFTFEDVERCIAGQQVTLPRVEWLEPAGVTIHEVQAKVNGEASSESKDGSDEFHRACEWLKGFLTEARPQEEVKAGWKSELLSERTIRRAKAHLLIGSEQRDRKWFWMPSPQVSIGSEIIGESHIAND